MQVANDTVVPSPLAQLGEIVRGGTVEVGCDTICLHLLQDLGERAPTGPEGRLLLQVVSNGYTAGARTHTLTLAECPAVHDAIVHDRVIAVEDAVTDPRVARKAIESFKIRACVYAPLRVHGDGVGVVIPSFGRRHGWTEPQIAAVRRVASMASEALEKAYARRLGVTG